MTDTAPSPYQARRPSRSIHHTVRGLRYHVRVWEPDPQRPCAGEVFFLHGWMDVSASFQFLVDAMLGNWRVLAPDWRGYGLTERPQADCYWFPDYLADLEALLDHFSPGRPANLVAHSMGGNVAMLYAGVRPSRVARLVNLEGVGLRGSGPEGAPDRYAQWLDELRAGARMRDYDDLAAVAQRLRANNPRLSPDKATFLAGHWSAPTASGRREILGDPAHKHVNPVLYRVEEVLACWRRITAPVLLVIAGHTSERHAYLHGAAFAERLRAVSNLERLTLPEAGHMLHHDQPQALAPIVEAFLSKPLAPAGADR